jgi:hypothetical protein
MATGEEAEPYIEISIWAESALYIDMATGLPYIDRGAYPLYSSHRSSGSGDGISSLNR